MSETVSLQQRKRIPDWLRLKLPRSSAFTQTRGLLEELDLHTVCESAKCPNHWECWSKGTATMIPELGTTMCICLASIISLWR